MPHAFGLTVRYAMKANPLGALLQLLHRQGIAIDACSGYEAMRAINAGIPAESIQITGQQWPHNLSDLIARGVKFCACSLFQLQKFGELFPGTDVGIRLNPGVGSGQFSQVNVGGIHSSFWIWHEYIEEAKKIVARYSLRIVTLHTHIGSGTDPDIWQNVAALSLSFAKKLPDVVNVDLGGGFKVARVPWEKHADVLAIWSALQSQFEAFYQETWRKLHMEIEPWTFLVANAWYLFSHVDDIVDTGKEGYTFAKLWCGMSEIIRPTIYGAQHPLFALNQSDTIKDYVVVGHSCESADLFTLDGQRNIATRWLPLLAIWDVVVIGGAGAYCSSMNTKHYNSYPGVAEYLWDGTSLRLIKAPEIIEDVTAKEIL